MYAQILYLTNACASLQETRGKAGGKTRGKGRRRQRRSRRRPRHTNLVYFERSPNFCDQNPATASSGTIGRYCNRTSSGIDNCETLCCGRGYNTLKVRYVKAGLHERLFDLSDHVVGVILAARGFRLHQNPCQIDPLKRRFSVAVLTNGIARLNLRGLVRLVPINSSTKSSSEAKYK